MSCLLYTSDIEKVVFHALTQFLALAQKESVQNREVGDLRKSAIKECAEKIRILQKQNEQHKASKLRLYEKYAAGSITKEAYIQLKAATDAKIAENDEAIQRSHERMKELDSETSCSDEKLDAVCNQDVYKRQSFIRSGNVQRLCAKRRFTLAHECAHQILFQLESEEVKASCEMRYSARTAYTPRELKTREDWNDCLLYTSLMLNTIRHSISPSTGSKCREEQTA